MMPLEEIDLQFGLPGEVEPLVQLRQEIETAQTRALQLSWPSAEELLASMQHDLRTPLGNILACIYLLQMEDPLTPGQAELLGIIEQAAGELLRQMDDLRDMQANLPAVHRE